MMSPELVTLPELVEVEDEVDTCPVEVETCPVEVETWPVEVDTCPVEVDVLVETWPVEVELSFEFELSISMLISPSNPLVDVVVVVVVVVPGRLVPSWPCP